MLYSTSLLALFLLGEGMVRGSGQLGVAKVEATGGTCFPVPRSNEEPAVSQSRGDAIQDAGRRTG